jgi:hypothetical protein
MLTSEKLFIVENLIVFVVKKLFQISNVFDEVLELSVKSRDLVLVKKVFLMDLVVGVCKVVILGRECGFDIDEEDVFLVEIGNQLVLLLYD